MDLGGRQRAPIWVTPGVLWEWHFPKIDHWTRLEGHRVSWFPEIASLLSAETGMSAEPLASHQGSTHHTGASLIAQGGGGGALR